ncbi:MAG: ABC transporter permease [Chloroflexi bacterium]|nr:ABC transporter permease [Chloroflexota bacterium]
MYRYIVRRLLLAIPVVWGAATLVFVAIRLMPGDAVLAQIEEKVQPTQEELQAMRAQLGLDVPGYVQYVRWLSGIAQGDLGNSLLTRKPVLDLLKQAVPSSLELGLLTALVAFSIAVPVGVISAIRQDTALDYVGRLISIGGLSIPSFVVATVVIIVPTLLWQWMPPVGIVPFWKDPGQNLMQYLPAAVSLGAHFSATTMRMTRSAVLEVLREDYVRTAHAKGLRERAVIYRHVLKNSMIPVITVMGSLLGGLLGGIVVVEVIFGLPGVGNLILRSIQFADYTALQAGIIFLAVMHVLVNLLVDTTYAWFDPRIRYS